MSGLGRTGIGGFGERHARRHLEAKGYRFVAANWCCRLGEIDLVLRDGAELVFVEVKTRRGERLGAAEAAITPVKARRLLALGEAFVAAHPDFADAVWRIDLLAITLDRAGRVVRVAHLPNAIVTG